ncbi:hypothetical protein GCM10029963_27440 [Micromonospora andamanensis]
MNEHSERAEDGPNELGKTVAALTADEIEPAKRRQLLARLVGQARARGISDLFKPRAALRWMVDTVAEIAPHVPVRDLATLRRHFPGLTDEELADRLVRNASRATAGSAPPAVARRRCSGRSPRACCPRRCCSPPRPSRWWRWS